MTELPQRANLKTLARHLGLSVTTVSRALHNGPEVRKETVERVQKAALELGYVRDLGGVKLRTGQSFTISLMMRTMGDGEFGSAGLLSLLAGIYEVASQSGYSVQAIPVNSNDNIQDKLRNLVEGRQTDGIIFDHTSPDDRRVDYLMRVGFPFVSFGRTSDNVSHPYFDVDCCDSAYRGAKALLEQGYRRIFHVTALNVFSFGLHRSIGFQRALSEAGISYTPELVAEIELVSSAARRATDRLLDRNIMPDAFLCANDAALMGVFASLKSHGLNPMDFGLCCSSGTPLGEIFPVTPIALHYPLRQSGRRLADLLIRRIAGEPAEQLQEIGISELVLP
ncbi:LacI family DNA-binding transcriptional regulator [Oryzibacter oryziterrae]|uniref:LacI family DNA-binding transcriptional regulator n=1 Tax=Oryzibacter oryziterrae TaxID=2766474 RepID=UPI001F2E4056|nr:LacI family DNA-binding transcriptional regulator [Oryzibacter oryziterrae]